MGTSADQDTTPGHGAAGRHSVRILLATDGSETAHAAGRFLAELLAPGIAQVHLLTVLSDALYPHGSFGERLSDDDERHAAIQEQEAAAFGELRQVFRSGGHKVTTGRRFGNPTMEILSEAREWGPDLIVAGRRGLGRAKSLVLGSVSERLLHEANVPVLIVP
jgi:nucleotide-binding universal stress UspA family protein